MKDIVLEAEKRDPASKGAVNAMRRPAGVRPGCLAVSTRRTRACEPAGTGAG